MFACRVAFEQLDAKSGKRLADGAYLRDDIDTAAIFVDHLPDTPKLTLYPGDAIAKIFLYFSLVHAP